MQRNTSSRTARTGRVLLTLTASVFAGTMAMLPTRYLVSAQQPVSGRLAGAEGRLAGRSKGDPRALDNLLINMDNTAVA